jgi:hypothetical protein
VSAIRSNWTRFTLMDGIILIAACSIGTYITTRFAQERQIAELQKEGSLGTLIATRFTRTDTRNSRPRVAVLWAVSCILWSGVIAAPLVLSSQRFRGRRSAPSPGEWFWLVPLVLFLTIAWSQLFGGPGSFLFITWVMLQCACSCAALFRLVRTFFGMNRDVACRWTDLLGCTVCGSVGPAILFEIYEALKQL